jgi:hypothetical protein
LFDLIRFLAEADSYPTRKEAALTREAEDLRERLEDTIDNMDLNQFLETLLVADQTVHRPRVEPRELDHPSFYWLFKNMDYDRWLAGGSEVLLLSGPTSCTLDRVSSHISGLMEGGCFGENRIVLNFFSPDGATRRDRGKKRKLDSEPTATIFVHTLLHQLISSAAASGKNWKFTASGFLGHLFRSIGSPDLLARFEKIRWEDSSAVIGEVLDIPDSILCEALGKVLEKEKEMGIVVNVLDSMRGQGRDFLTAVSTFVERLRERSPGIKVLLTCGSVQDSGKALGGLRCIKVEYDKERKGLISQFPTIRASNVANKCRVP